MSSNIFTQGVFCFFNISVVSLIMQEGRVDFVETGSLNTGREESLVSKLVIQLLHLPESKPMGEMNSSSVLLLKGSMQMYKCVLVVQNDRVLPP